MAKSTTIKGSLSTPYHRISLITNNFFIVDVGFLIEEQFFNDYKRSQ